MEFHNVSVLSVAHTVPPHRVTSSWIDDQLTSTLERLGMRSGLLEQLSGIVARRFWDEGMAPSQMATTAAKKAIDLVDFDPQRIGMLINTSVCRDFVEPSTACRVHRNLGLSQDCFNFDLGNACLGFIDGMNTAATMIESGRVDYALIVDGEGSRHLVTETMKRLADAECTSDGFRREFAALTLGSGAAAMVLARSDLAPEGHRYRCTVHQAATEWSHLCHGTAEQMITDTHPLMVEGLKLARTTWDRAANAYGWAADHFDHFILHQVSKVHTQQLCTSLGIDTKRCFQIFPEWGNIGPAGLPLALSLAAEEGRLKRGQRIAMLGIGSGLNCMMSELTW